MNRFTIILCSKQERGRPQYNDVYIPCIYIILYIDIYIDVLVEVYFALCIGELERCLFKAAIVFGIEPATFFYGNARPA